MIGAPGKTRDDIEQDVRVLLGGMANEELFFGEALHQALSQIRSEGGEWGEVR